MENAYLEKCQVKRERGSFLPIPSLINTHMRYIFKILLSIVIFVVFD